MQTIVKVRVQAYRGLKPETDIRMLEEKVESDKRTLLEEELYIKRKRSSINDLRASEL